MTTTIETSDFKIKGAAKRQEQQKKEDLQRIREYYKQYQTTKMKVRHLEEKKNSLLKNKLLPYIQKELEFIQMINTDSKEQYQQSQRKFIKDITGNDQSTIAFIKKHLKNI